MCTCVHTRSTPGCCPQVPAAFAVAAAAMCTLHWRLDVAAVAARAVAAAVLAGSEVGAALYSAVLQHLPTDAPTFSAAAAAVAPLPATEQTAA